MSNDRYYFCLSTDVFNYENRYKIEKLYAKRYLFPLYFSAVNISANNVPYILKSREPLGDVHFEGTVSQKFVLDTSFYFMSKNGKLLNFIKIEPGPISKF